MIVAHPCITEERTVLALEEDRLGPGRRRRLGRGVLFVGPGLDILRVTAGGALLYDVGQLVRQQVLPFRTGRIELSRIEINVTAMCKCLRAELAVHTDCVGICMDGDPAKVSAKRRLHLGQGRSR
jgi:hypothetical protein